MTTRISIQEMAQHKFAKADFLMEFFASFQLHSVEKWVNNRYIFELDFPCSKNLVLKLLKYFS